MRNNAQKSEKTLTSKQRRTIAALLDGRTQEDAALAVGVTTRTVQNWMVNPGFVDELQQAQRALISESVRALVADMKTNRRTMQTIRDDESQPAAVRLRASIAIDESLHRWDGHNDLLARIVALEEVTHVNNKP